MSTGCTVKYDKMEEEKRKRGKCERKRSKEEHKGKISVNTVGI
jgi:hypothetical protein